MKSTKRTKKTLPTGTKGKIGRKKSAWSALSSLSSVSVLSSRAAAPVGAYPHARRVGNLIFLSGIGPREPGTDLIPKGIEAEIHSTFRNVKAVLEEAGATWDAIVDIQVFLTDMRRDFPVFNRIYAEYFKNNQPTRTTIEVGALPTPIHIEIKIIAAVGKAEKF